jgi:hypothetical protein
MKDKLTPLTKQTLQRVQTEFPTHHWSDHELEELLSPQYGIITSFQKIIEDARKLIEIDLNAIEPAGELPVDRD